MSVSNGKTGRVKNTKLFATIFALLTKVSLIRSVAYGPWLDEFSRKATELLPGFKADVPQHQRGVAFNNVQNVMKGLGVVAITLAIVLLVVNEVFQSITIPSSSLLSDADNAVRNNTGTALLLGGVALIVIAASVILDILGGAGFGR